MGLKQIKRSSYSKCGFLLFAFLLAVWQAGAQSPTAQLSGAVSDATGAVVPDVTVQVTNTQTGVASQTSTNAQGIYVFPGLLPGPYRVEVEKQGFERTVRTGVALTVGQSARLDLALTVGVSTQSVEVTATESPLQTDSASTSQVVGAQQVSELPLNGRNFLQLARLSAGVLPPKTGDRAASGGSFIANGVRAQVNNYMLDGIDNNAKIVDQANGSPVVIQPSVDAIAEFRVETNNYSAEYGYSAGAVVNATLKSGGNSFHGDGFEFVRNSAVDAKSFFLASSAAKPPLNRNQFGGTLGGPVRRNRIFFFSSYEGTRLKTGGTTYVLTVPTDSLRSGNFAGQKTIFDSSTLTQNGSSYSRQPFPGNVIPASRFDAMAVKLLAVEPEPNVAGQSFNNYISSPIQTQPANRLDSRGDMSISSVDQLFVRYSYTRGTNFSPGPFPTPAVGAISSSATRSEVNRSHGAGVGETHTFSSSLVNEFRLGYNRMYDALQPINQVDTPASFGFRGIPDMAGLTGLPYVSISGYASLGDYTSEPNLKISETGSVVDHVSWLKGSHQFRLGGSYRWVRSLFNNDATARGSFTFDGTLSQDPNSRSNTGSALADFLTGTASTAGLSNPTKGDLRYRYAGVFVQDDWKATTRLTLNLGVRWEMWTQPIERNDLQANFLPEYAKLAFANNATPTGISASALTPVPDGDDLRSLLHGNGGTFSPRVGLAYQLNSKTVIRSGFGLFAADAPFVGGSARPPANPPYFESVTFPTDQLHTSILMAQGFPAGTISSNIVNLANVGLISWAEDQKNGYVLHWSFGVQEQLRGFVVEANYNGTKGTDLPTTYNINAALPGGGSVASRRPFQGYSDINRTQPFDSTSYNALTVRAERHLSRGLSFLVSYSFSKMIDLGGEQLVGDGLFRNTQALSWEKALSSADMRHYASVSFSYGLPVGKGKLLSLKGPVDAMLGNWQVNGILSAHTGLPFTPELGTSSANTGDPRPNRLGSGVLSSSQRSILGWFDKSAFAAATAYNFGNSGRDILQGPGSYNVDLSLFKDVPLRKLGEAAKLQFRAEAFNLFNHPEFANPNNRVDIAAGGTITSLSNPMRTMQGGVKLIF